LGFPLGRYPTPIRRTVEQCWLWAGIPQGPECENTKRVRCTLNEECAGNFGRGQGKTLVRILAFRPCKQLSGIRRKLTSREAVISLMLRQFAPFAPIGSKFTNVIPLSLMSSDSGKKEWPLMHERLFSKDQKLLKQIAS